MTSTAFELAPGAVRAWKTAHQLAAAVHAVPQYTTLHLPLEDGWGCWLDKFKYRPLNKPGEIRVLRLYPSETRLKSQIGSFPRCELIHTTLADLQHRYVALSYAWGDIKKYSPIVLQDDQCLTITNSLWDAFGALNSPEPIDFWCDQICINQYDLIERSYQVNLISQIFERATMTLVWLGASDDTTDVAYDLISALSHTGITLSQSKELLDMDNVQGLSQSLHVNGIDFDHTGWLGVGKLAERPWFSRLWTFQEVVVSRNVIYRCGDRYCKHDDLLRAFYMFELFHRGQVIEKTHLAMIRRYRTCYHTDRSCFLPQLLRDTSSSYYKCQLPQDRVYALLALQDTRPANRINIEVDYNQPVEKVFEETARAIINGTGDLSIIHRRRYGYIKDLPSWAPDWNALNLQEAINDDHMRFSCAKGMQHCSQNDVDGEMTVKGRVIACVTKIAAHQFSFYGTKYEEGELDIFLGSETLLPLIFNALKQYKGINDRSLLDSASYRGWLMATTLICGRILPQDEAEFQATDISREPVDIVAIIMRKGLPFVQSMVKCLGRSLGLLDNDACPLSLLPDYSRPGDLVCVIEGSVTPLVLRKKDQGYEYIGECYTHGIMYGEAVMWEEGAGEEFKLI